MRPSTAGRAARTQFDYSVAFKDWWQRDIDAMVLRDRNHPSVVMWSIGNEIPERGEPLGAQEAKMIADYLRTLDRTRPITSALNSVRNWPDTDGFYSALDLGGYNYNLENHAADHKRVPVADHGLHRIVPQQTFDYWAMVNDFPYIVGDFVWTALDYLGESGLGAGTTAIRRTPARRLTARRTRGTARTAAISISAETARPPRTTATSSGIAARSSTSACGSPRPKARKCGRRAGASSRSTQAGPGPGMEGKPLEVEIYSRGDTVRLYLGDKPIAEKPTTRAEQFKANFSVPYAPGVLKAVAIKDGKAMAETVLRTAGEPARVRLTADRTPFARTARTSPSSRWKRWTPTASRIPTRNIR